MDWLAGEEGSGSGQREWGLGLAMEAICGSGGRDVMVSPCCYIVVEMYIILAGPCD